MHYWSQDIVKERPRENKYVFSEKLKVGKEDMVINCFLIGLIEYFVILRCFTGLIFTTA